MVNGGIMHQLSSAMGQAASGGNRAPAPGEDISLRRLHTSRVQRPDDIFAQRYEEPEECKHLALHEEIKRQRHEEDSTHHHLVFHHEKSRRDTVYGRATVGNIEDTYPDHMYLDRVKLLDVNGLVGRSQRHPITGNIYLKEVESWRDFHVVDLWSRKKIHGLPLDLSQDKMLFRTKPLNMRTWIYHCKFREAFKLFRIGLETEVFFEEALNTRCIDLDVWTGGWSPFMIYAPLLPFTLLADDSNVFVFCAIVAFISLCSSVATNGKRLYFWNRPMLLPLRLAFMVFTAMRVKGGSVQMMGYVGTLLFALVDLFLGDFQQLRSMKTHCHYEVIRALPKQVFLCSRVGDNDTQAGEFFRSKRFLPEKVTGMKDPGDHSLCLVANIQGLIVELIPLQKEEDAPIFTYEYHTRMMEVKFGHAENMKYFGVDLFSQSCKSLQDYDLSFVVEDPMDRVVALHQSQTKAKDDRKSQVDRKSARNSTATNRNSTASQRGSQGGKSEFKFTDLVKKMQQNKRAQSEMAGKKSRYMADMENVEIEEV